MPNTQLTEAEETKAKDDLALARVRLKNAQDEVTMQTAEITRLERLLESNTQPEFDIPPPTNKEPANT